MSSSNSVTAAVPSPGHWPAWFHQDQQKAWDLFNSLPLPSRRDEPWRFANIKATDLSGFSVATPVRDAAALIARSSGLSDLSAKLVFGNDILLHAETAGLPAGVLVLPLEKAASEHEGLFKKSFMASEVRLGSKKFAALHRARLSTGAFVHVPKGIAVPKPIEIWHWVEGEGTTVFPHTLIVLEERSEEHTSELQSRFGISYAAFRLKQKTAKGEQRK